MKNLLMLIVLIFTFNYSNAQGWLWATEIDGSSDLTSKGLGIDTANNIYVLSELYGTATIQGNTLNSRGDKDIQLTKLNNAGTLLWTIQAGYINTDDPKDIFTDKQGNSYIVGSFIDTAMFGTDTIFTELSGDKDAFIAKYNSNGDIVWVKNFAWGANVQKGTGITVNDSGYISIVGLFKDQIIFGDTIGAPNCDTLIKEGNSKNYFYVKLDLNGNYILSKQLKTNNAGIAMNYITNTPSSGYYISGYYTDNLIIDTDTLHSKGGRDIAIINIDNQGNVLWTKSFGDSDNDEINNISTDNDNSIYIIGNYIDSLIFDNDTLIGHGTNYNIFLAKLDSFGNEIWAKTKGGYGSDYGWSVTYKDNMLQISGSYNDTIIWGHDTITTSSSSNIESFFCKANASTGDEISIEKIQSDNSDQKENPRDIVIDFYGNLYITGLFESSNLYFDSDTLTNISPGNSDVFIARYGCKETYLNFAIDSLSCSNDTNGTIKVTPTITHQYDYLWSTGDTTDSISGLSKGVYKVTLSTPWGCSYTDSVFLTNKHALESYLIDTITLNCAQDSSDTVAVTPAFGIPAYSYSWDNGSTDSSTSKLDTGLHIVSISDQCGTIKDSIFVAHIPSLQARMDKHSIIVLCQNSKDGEATLETTNGYGTQVFAWDNGDTRQTADSLTVGIHYVTVHDGCNVNIIDSVRVNYMPPLTLTTSLLNKASCSTSNNGKAKVVAVAGIAPYTYNWDNNDTNAITDTLTVGIHYVTVTDGCKSLIDSVEVTVMPPLSITAVTQLAKANCADSSSGSALVTYSDGVAPYSFAWDNGETNDTALALDTGWAKVNVTDACGTLTDSVKIEYETPLSITAVTQLAKANCADSSSGSALVTYSDGVAPYSFAWDNGETNDTALALDTGWAKVSITDACGTLTDSVKIEYETPLSITSVTQLAKASCANSTNGSALITYANGVAPYSITWDNAETNDTALALDTGWAKVNITDACGTLTDSVKIEYETPLSITSVTQLAKASCANSTNGSALVTYANGMSPYSILWKNGETTDTATALGTGWVTVQVTDACSDTVKDSVEIEHMPSFSLISTTILKNATCKNTTDGSAVVTIANGSSPYTYTWDTVAKPSTSTLTDTNSTLSFGIHYINIVDACSDTVKDSVSITAGPDLKVKAMTDSLKCYNDKTGEITLIVTSGVAPYHFSWTHDISSTDSITKNLYAGTYHYKVTDQCGAIEDSVAITQPEKIAISTKITNASTDQNNDGTVTITVTGGTAPYSYAWSNGSSMQNLDNLAYGTYEITVTDANLCEAHFDSIIVNADEMSIVIYNAFTPNNDNVNDVWNIKNLSTYTKCSVKIFNEWGNEVFSSTGYAKPWDGTYNGKPLPAATYYYIIDLGNGRKPYTGTVNIIY